MSDFLSREADLFGGEFGGSKNGGGSGGDEIDFDRAASAFPDISLDGSDIPSVPVAAASNSGSRGFSFDDFGFDAPNDNGNVKVTGDDDIDKFENHFPELEVEQHAPPAFAQSAPTFAPRPQPSAYSSTPILTQQIPEEEPQVIRDWREKQQAEIQAREEAAKARRQETISKAERAIDEFYEEYSKKKERNIRENKDTEAEFIADQTSSLASGTTWERICELVELQNSQSKTLSRTGPGTTDLARFKEVLLRLKREGDSAPGAAGY